MIDHGEIFFGRCSWCYWKVRRSLPDLPYYERLSTEIYDAVPAATKLYAPSCKCGQGCGDDYLCDACAATVDNQLYIEDL